MIVQDSPARGVVKVPGIAVDSVKLVKDLETLESAWEPMNPGDECWEKIVLLRDGNSHPKYLDCESIVGLVRSFEAEPITIIAAALLPGGIVKEHRDISGGSAFGVTRFHVPVITNERVEFFVEGNRIPLAEGEVWCLDTTYLHSLANHSDERRIHLILDYRTNAHIKKLLPHRDLADFLHILFFFWCCIVKGVSLIREPRTLCARIVKTFRLAVFRRSSL
jgi:hypothetical protein